MKITSRFFNEEFLIAKQHLTPQKRSVIKSDACTSITQQSTQNTMREGPKSTTMLVNSRQTE
jgi:hypothetical protein